MLLLIDRNLEIAEQNVLDDLQSRVNTEIGFARQVAKAQSLWDNKKGNATGKRSFERITQILTDMCVFVKTCNYCEGNEANDIEHIYPKSFFPEKTFVWNNYLLACKQCNTGYKLDKCFVLDTDGNIHQTTRGIEPIYKTVAIIHPRTDNPNLFLWLNTKVWKFELHEELSDTDSNKAIKTLEILALNERDYLIEGRKKTYGELFDKMDRLRRIKNATTIREIEDAIAPYHDDVMDLTLPIDSIRQQAIQSTQQHIQKQLHPSVWYAIKTIESQVDTRWQRIFTIIPEAMNW